MVSTPTDRTRQSVLRQITELPTLSMRELMERWRDLYGTEPPPHNKKYLLSRLAYRIQELAFGGVKPETLQRLEEHLQAGKFTALGMRRGNAAAPQALYKAYAVGTVIRREWNGCSYEVTVVQNGFDYAGRVYKHLSPIATAITGQHLNGNAFFGLKARKKE
jgi:hypothetical protein